MTACNAYPLHGKWSWLFLLFLLVFSAQVKGTPTGNDPLKNKQVLSPIPEADSTPKPKKEAIPVYDPYLSSEPISYDIDDDPGTNWFGGGAPKKGNIQFTASFPAFQLYSINGQLDRQKHPHPWIFTLAAGGGVEYYYANKRFLSLKIEGAITPTFDGHDTTYRNNGDAVSVALTNHHVLGRFNLGYGLHWSNLHWSEGIEKDTANSVWLNSHTSGYGLNFSVQFMFNDNLGLAVQYQTVLTSAHLKKLPLGTQHCLMFNFVWKFPVYRK